MSYGSKIVNKKTNNVTVGFCLFCYSTCSGSCSGSCRGGCSASCGNGCSGNCGNNCTDRAMGSSQS